MLGDKIREARKKASLTQSELAEKIGVKRSVVSKYENGQISPTYEMLSNIATALNTSVSYLVDEAFNDKSVSYLTMLKNLSQLTGINELVLAEANSRLDPNSHPYFDFSNQEAPLNALLEKAREVQQEFDDFTLNTMGYLLKRLNDEGINEAIERVHELTLLPKYQRKKDNR